MDGLRTALIVRDPNDPMEYDEEKIITLSGKIIYMSPLYG
jgi:FtsP/CotA-like multicopper oxidase with cupredoxin domain